MKLWLLRPADNLKKGDDPWEPWYDKCFGMVIRAKTEQEARDVANQNAGDENVGINAKTKTPWLDEKYSTCEILTNAGEAGLIIRDYASA